MITPKDISIIIPVGHSVNRTIKILQSNFVQRAQIVLVADSDKVYSRLIKNSPKYKNITVIRNKKRGASSARNYGIQFVERKFIWFLDSDCIPTEVNLSKITELFSDINTIAIGGCTIHEENNFYIKQLFSHCEITKPYLCSQYENAFFSPSSNLLIRANVLKKMNENPFPEFYPYSGGGEDVHFCFELTKFGKIIRSNYLKVSHPKWPNCINSIKKFLRWGWAEGLLTIYATKKNGFILHQMSVAFFLILYLISLPIIFLFNLNSTNILFHYFLIYLIIYDFLLNLLKLKNILNVFKNILFSFVFDISGLLCRVAYGKLHLLLIELKYNPNQKVFSFDNVFRMFGIVTIIFFWFRRYIL